MLRSEDQEMSPQERQKLISLQRDVQRNFAIARWMIARHLDYTTTFSFQAKTGNEALDDRLEYLVNERWSKAENCDIAARHPLRRIIRLAEARRCVDNDCGLLKLTSGHLQAIEGDRIKSPPGFDANVIHGVQVDPAGKPLGYAICRRGAGTNSFVFERMVPAKNLYLHAHYDRFDQVRGISPLTAGLNTLRDCYEGFDLALAKMKVSQLFGLSIYRDAAEGGFVTEEDGDGQYSIDFGKGPLFLDLSPGDRAEFLESKSPAVEQQQFFQTMIQVALKSLDIPYSFYAENYTNYSGARQALLQYEQSADIKRADVRDMLDHLTAWRLGLFIQDGELPGVTLDQLRWEWISKGLPWLDPLKEITAEIQAIDAGLDNPEDIAQRHGKNFYENIDKIAACRAYADSKGVQLSTISTMTIVERNHETTPTT
jgi:capsid protein